MKRKSIKRQKRWIKQKRDIYNLVHISTDRSRNKKLEKKKRIVQDKVKGSDPDFPYEERSFKLGGTIETVAEAGRIAREKQILETQKAETEELKQQVEEWMQKIPFRVQRIIRCKFFKELKWEEVATLMGRKCTGEGIEKEFQRFMKEK